MKIRKYNPQDKQEVIELIRQFFEYHQRLSDPEAVYTKGDAEEDLEEWLSYPNSILLCSMTLA